MPPTPRELGAGPCTGALTVLHTAQVEPELLDAAHRLVVDAFEGGFEDADWEHALGGLHAFVHVDGELVAHGSVVQRRLLHRGRALRVGYVEAVAVAPPAQGRGHASTVMAALEDVVRRAYDAGALSATDRGAQLYRRRGWLPWRGSTWALTPDGRVRTPEDDDAVLVLPGTARLDLDGELMCDWRDGDLW